METSVLLAAAATLVAIYLLQWLLYRRKLPPGPTGVPILGYLPFLTRKPYLDFTRLAKKYGNVFSLKMGTEFVVILNDYESTKECFAKEAFIGRPPVTPFNLNKETRETQAMDGPPWKEQRRFSLHMLRDLGFGKTKMEGHITEEIEELLGMLEKKEGKPYCIYELLAPSMSNNISSLVFGKRMKYDDPDREMLTRVLKDTASAAGQATWQLFFPTLRNICSKLGIGDVDRVNRIQQEIKDYVCKEIAEHDATLDPQNVRDFIDGYLLEIQRRKGDPCFCKPVLQDLVGGFFGAGSETVRLTVEWLVLTSAHFQDGQRRVQKEIDEVLGRNQFPTYQNQKDMPYTQAFIQELMRWRTIIPINIIRYAITEGEIGGYYIPKNSQIISNLWAIHHNPEYWGRDAEEFRPERFMTENGEVKKMDHFIPFSIGKRACPGEPFAKVEVFLYFVSILQKFDITLPEGKKADFEGELGIGFMAKPQELIYTKRK